MTVKTLLGVADLISLCVLLTVSAPFPICSVMSPWATTIQNDNLVRLKPRTSSAPCSVKGISSFQVQKLNENAQILCLKTEMELKGVQLITGR